MSQSCHLVGYLYPTWNVQGVFQVLAPSIPVAPGCPAAAAPGCAQQTEQKCGAPEDAQTTGRVWELSRDPEGCWRVQRALEVGKSDDACSAIAAELKGHVWEAVRCPNANHVIQKCIIMLRPRTVQFIIDEIMTGPIVFQAVRHRYGCRVVQRLLEQCLPDQVHGLAEAILSDVYWLSRHPYGNYVVQSLLEHGTQWQRQRTMESVAASASSLVSDAHGRSVVNACLFIGPDEGKAVLARALWLDPGLVECMSRTRHGRSAVKIAQEVLRPSKASKVAPSPVGKRGGTARCGGS